MSRLLLLALLVMTAALAAATDAAAHQDGCHRWHSCPSDNGSYVCGDLGYTSGCGGGTPSAPPPVPPDTATSRPSPPELVGPADGATIALGSVPVLAAVVPPHTTGLDSVWIHVSKTPAVGADGTLNIVGSVDFAEMTPMGNGGFAWRPSATSDLLRKAGTYFWQAHRIDCTGAPAASDCAVETAVRRLVVAAPPTCPLRAERRGSRVRITFCPRTVQTEIAFRRSGSGPALRARRLTTRPGEAKSVTWLLPRGARFVKAVAIDADGRRSPLGGAVIPRR